ncbi:hypothetical protein MWH25_01390 [Natroniella acetigena]|uniref:hypothetical protein n=1 Tax=Natroniella acetigena TaxID=52004 RepID=UPI00200ADDA3|nr:hypothetical protein [Natroniella acetigena]MCK8826401.1 hypothetical protein [Natroniella acetigena]
MKSNRFMSEALKVDVGLDPQTINNDDETGDWFKLQMFRKALFVVTAHGDATGEITAKVYKAKDDSGDSSEHIEELEITVDGDEGVGFLEVDAVVLNNEGEEGFSHVAVNVENEDEKDIEVAVSLLRGLPRYSFEQEVDNYAIKS